VRRMFEEAGFEVAELRRVRIGPIKLGQLPQGKWRVLRPEEVKQVLETARTGPRESPGSESKRRSQVLAARPSRAPRRARFNQRGRSAPHARAPTTRC
jgi:hypothetical protein